MAVANGCSKLHIVKPVNIMRRMPDCLNEGIRFRVQFHVNGRFQPSPGPASCDQASEWGKATLRRQITDTAQGREIGQRQMQPDHRSFTAGTTEEIGRASCRERVCQYV